MQTLQVLEALVGAATVFWWIGFRYAEPPWMQDRALMTTGLWLSFAYAVGFLLVRSRLLEASSAFTRLLRAGAVWATVCLPVVLAVLLTGLELQRLTLLGELALVLGLLVVNGVGVPRKIAFFATVLVLVFGLRTGFSDPARASFADIMSGRRLDPDESTQFVISSLHDLRIVRTEIAPRVRGVGADRGGGFEPLDDSHLLLVDGNGHFYVLTVRDHDVVRAALPAINAPMNRDEYERDVPSPSLFFAITDILLVDDGVKDQRTLYIADHHWNHERACATLNVDEATLDLNALDRHLAWTNRFTSTPCITNDHRIGNETGGRLALTSDGRLLLTVGITSVDSAFWDVATRDDASYGKIMQIDRSTWQSKIFSKGHRNPQGLFVDGDRIWSTEHGPDGGDELNIIQEGGDYGWPTSSYGLDYGRKTLKGNRTPGEHTFGIHPVYAWVPSLGISRVIKAQGIGFPGWQGDLLIGSLSKPGFGLSVYRLRLFDDVVKVVERIETGAPVRDLVEMPNGAIMLWDGVGAVQAMTSAVNVFGSCSGCHSVSRFRAHGIGPDLFGVVGNTVASAPEFEYTQGMKDFGGRWTVERLDAFLASPKATVPGTSMEFPGIENPDERRAIIDFLRKTDRRDAPVPGEPAD